MSLPVLPIFFLIEDYPEFPPAISSVFYYLRCPNDFHINSILADTLSKIFLKT